MVLTSMIGAAREKYLNKEIVDTSQKNRKMISLLGSILCLSRKVLEQRDFISNLHEKYVAGELVQDSFGLRGVTTPARDLKRKRKRSESGVEDQDVLFINESDAQSEASSGSVSSSEKGDIISFYKQRKH